MNLISFLTLLLTAAFTGTAVLCSTLGRLPSLLRAYATSSFSLGLLAIAVALEEGTPHLLIMGAVILLVKAILVPLLIARAAERTHLSHRIASSLKPSMTLFVSTAIFSVGFFLAMRSPFLTGMSTGLATTYLLPISVGLLFVGFMMMIIRRDVISQAIGFLVMENAIAAFSLTALGGIPNAIEFGVYSMILLGAVLVATVSSRAQLLYGTADTAEMTELID